MTRRPRKVGTFLISRPETSAKLAARARMRSMPSRSRSSMESRCLIDHPRLRPPGQSVRPGCAGLSQLDDADLVDPVELLDAGVDALRARGREVLADVVRAD